MNMICDRCGRVGIRWMGPFSNLTHTECPHCGGRNCQRTESVDDADFDAGDQAREDAAGGAGRLLDGREHNDMPEGAR